MTKHELFYPLQISPLKIQMCAILELHTVFVQHIFAPTDYRKPQIINLTVIHRIVSSDNVESGREFKPKEENKELKLVTIRLIGVYEMGFFDKLFLQKKRLPEWKKINIF